MKNFLKRFTWKEFFIYAVVMFVLTLGVACLIDDAPVSSLFTTSALLHRAFTAILVGFIFSCMFDSK